MTAADTLRLAAARLREAAEAASPGEWRTETYAIDHSTPDHAHFVSAFSRRDQFGRKWLAMVASCTETDTPNGPNAAYIALVGPDGYDETWRPA